MLKFTVKKAFSNPVKIKGFMELCNLAEKVVFVPLYLSVLYDSVVNSGKG